MQAVGSHPSKQHPIILYDNSCGICQLLNCFVLRHDIDQNFRFAALQSTFARTILARHCASPNELDTVYIVFHYNESNEILTTRSFAFASVLKQLGGIWWLMGGAAGRVPKPLRDPVYRFIVRHRSLFFTPAMPTVLIAQEHRARFLDI